MVRTSFARIPAHAQNSPTPLPPFSRAPCLRGPARCRGAPLAQSLCCRVRMARDQPVGELGMRRQQIQRFPHGPLATNPRAPVQPTAVPGCNNPKLWFRHTSFGPGVPPAPRTEAGGVIHLKRPISSELSLKKEREMKAFATIPTLKEFITSSHSLRRTLVNRPEGRSSWFDNDTWRL